MQKDNLRSMVDDLLGISKPNQIYLHACNKGQIIS